MGAPSPYAESLPLVIDDVWSPVEKQLGHGFAGVPVDNVGVQYGLSALKSGDITPARVAVDSGA